jgi:hypothetical protein
MKYKEEEILAKAKKILFDLNGEFYNEKDIEGLRFIKNDIVTRPKKNVLDTWTIFINEPLFGGSSVFLIISDETGEPLYIQGKHSIHEIKKNEQGKYY